MRNITKFLSQINIEPPAGFALAEQLRQAVNIAATTNPVGDLEADILEGKVTPKQVTARVADCARTLTEREKAREVARDLEPVFVRLSRRSLLDGAPDLIENMRPAFDAAVATVVEATEVIGTEPDDASVGRMGPAAAIHWEARKAAAETLKAIHRVRDALAQVHYGSQVTVAAYLAECPDGLVLDQAQQTFHARGEGLVNLAAHGYQLRLNLAEEADQIAAGARLATEEADRAAREAAQATANAKARSYADSWKAVADDARAKAQAAAS